MFGSKGSSSQRMKQRGFDAFVTWGVLRKVGLGLLGIAFLLMVFLGTIPIGFATLFTLIMIAKLWKSVDNMNDPTLGQLTPGTFAYKLSSLMTTIKEGPLGAGTWRFVHPLVSLGAGAPEDEPRKGIVAGFFPPTRMTSYWAMPIAITLSTLDYAMNPILFPFWGSWHLPALAATALSSIGWYATMQVVVAANRYARAKETPNLDFYPAVMMNRIPRGGELVKDIIVSMLLALVSTSFVIGITVLMARFTLIPWWITVVSSLMSFVAGVLFHLTSRVRKLYNADVESELARANFWDDAFDFANPKIPKYENEVAVPSEDDWRQQNPDEIYDPHVWVATFSFPLNATYDDYAGMEDKIKPSMETPERPGRTVCIAPIPQPDEQGNAIRGSVSSIGIRVWWTDKQLTMQDLLSGELRPEEIEIAVRVFILNTLSKIKSIGRCEMYSVMSMTTKQSRSKILKIQVIPRTGVGEKHFLSSITEIQDALGVPWVRAMKEMTRDKISVVTLYVGDRFDSEGISFIQPTTKVRNELTMADWAFIFYDCKVSSSAGSPKLLSTRPVTEESNELVFSAPPGVDAGELLSKKEKLRTSAGNAFLEISDGLPSAWSSKEKDRKRQEFKRKGYNSQFSMVSAVKHPLDKMFPFGAFRDELIGAGREPGIAKPTWGIGMMSNGEIVYDDFEGSPSGAHLLIAGSSGSGKSVVLHNMVSQLASKNDPVDLEFHIVEPKNGTQIFENLDSVTRYVDSWVPREGEFFEATRDLIIENVEEMERRNKLMRMRTSMQKPEKLSEARAIAMKEGDLPDGSPHPLWMPYRILIVEECATVFTGCTDKEGKEVQAEILYYVGRIAREARSAGILLVCLTQYPTNASIPSLFRQQMRRIGLKTKDSLASDIIIGQRGLESLNFRGSLMAEHDGAFKEARGFFLNHDFDDVEKDDVVRVLKSLPSRKADGQVTASTSSVVNPYIDMPDIDDSVFGRWESTKMARTLDYAERKGKLESVTGLKHPASIQDQDFDLGSLEDFKRNNAEYLGLLRGTSMISMNGTGGIPSSRKDDDDSGKHD